MSKDVFVDRRKGDDRREFDDPCRDLPVDIHHRKRRKRIERRADRTLIEDYYAFSGNQAITGTPNNPYQSSGAKPSKEKCN